LAEQADRGDISDGVNLPAEIKRREDRLKVMVDAKAKIEARELAECQAKMARREAKARDTGKKPGGKPPQPPNADPGPQDQINLTDEDSRIMPTAGGGGFEQAYNAQAAVDTGSLLVVTPTLTQAPNDKQQVTPMLAQIGRLPAHLGQVERLLADTGYCSGKNVEACEQAGIEPFLAVAREDHHPHWRDRFTEPEPPSSDATPMEHMAHRLKTQVGRAVYALRKQTVEPVFDIIKSVLGFRQFLLRGLDIVTGEWRLVCLAWNLKRMDVLRLQTGKTS